MYAIIKTGGKQYKAEQGGIIKVEKLNVEPTKEITLEEVLLLSDGQDVKIGRPHIDGAKVICEVVSQIKDRKVIAFNFMRRKGSKTKKGHRQLLTRLRVKEIVG